MKYKDTMYFLDKRTGELLNSTHVPPIPPFDNTVMRGSPNYSADGKYLAAAASDGRGMLFDEAGKILWTRSISKPQEVDGAYVNASGRDGFVTPYGVLFTTINTFNREIGQLPTPVEHPSNNSIFVFNTDGTFRYHDESSSTNGPVTLERVTAVFRQELFDYRTAVSGILMEGSTLGHLIFAPASAKTYLLCLTTRSPGRESFTEIWTESAPLNCSKISVSRGRSTPALARPVSGHLLSKAGSHPLLRISRWQTFVHNLLPNSPNCVFPG